MSYIIFQNDKAFRHLVKKKIVFTLRAHNRKEGVVKLKRNKHSKSIGLVRVEFIGNVVKKKNGDYIVKTKDNEINLEEFVKYSGFNSLEEWLCAFWKYYKRVNTIKLYKVTLIQLFYKFLF